MKYQGINFRGQFERNLQKLLEKKVVKAEDFTNSSKIPRFLELLNKANINWLNYGYTFKNAEIKEVAPCDIEYYENRVRKVHKGLWHVGKYIDYRNKGEFVQIPIGGKVRVFEIHYYGKIKKECIEYRKKNVLTAEIKRGSELQYIIFAPQNNVEDDY
jgi:hypothetical protein